MLLAYKATRRRYFFSSVRYTPYYGIAWTQLFVFATFVLSLLVPNVFVAGRELYVSIVPHSHCDPGWLSTFEGYYSAEVGSILSSVMEALAADRRRRFVWAETSFFMRWLEVQSEVVKHRVRQLVASGQLEFVGGGWVQHDEANPSYDAIIAQVAEGHDYLASLFGVKPRIAYSIDPFGSAASSAALAALTGYDALVINRVDHTVKDALKARAALEFIWRPYAQHPQAKAEVTSTSQARNTNNADVQDISASVLSYANTSIFTHVLHTHYSAPKGFDFENPEGVPVSESNVKSRAETLVSELRFRAAAYRTSHLLVLHGDDFKFMGSGARAQFDNLDKLLDYIALHNVEGNGELSGVHVSYSTLSEYFDAVFAESAGASADVHAALFRHAQLQREGKLPHDAPPPLFNQIPSTPSAQQEQQKPPPAQQKEAVHTDTTPVGGAVIPFPEYRPVRGFVDGGVDFYPYADNAMSWWTGYYTSRPSLKQAIRRTLHTLRSTEALFALVRPWASTWQSAATALALERDAVLSSPTDAQTSTAATTAASILAGASPYATYSWEAAFQRVEQTRLDLALCLHHDAITGTSRPEVVEDYTTRLRVGTRAATAALSDLASLLLGGLPRALVHSRAHDSMKSTRRRMDPHVKGSTRRGEDPNEVSLLAAQAVHQLQLASSSHLIDLSDVIALEPASLTHVPHVLPVALRLPITAFVTKRASRTPVNPEKGEGENTKTDTSDTEPLFVSLRVHPDTPAHPIVIHNSHGWRRRAVVTVSVDIGSHIAAAATAAIEALNMSTASQASREAKATAMAAAAKASACFLHRWPFAVVTDDNGVPVPSQWLANSEKIRSNTASHALTNYATAVTALQTIVKDNEERNGQEENEIASPLFDRFHAFGITKVWSSAAFDVGSTSTFGPLLSSGLVTDSVLGEDSVNDAVNGYHASDLRYELAFEVDIPPLALSTYFVTIAWDVEGSNTVSELASDADRGESNGLGQRWQARMAVEADRTKSTKKSAKPTVESPLPVVPANGCRLTGNSIQGITTSIPSELLAVAAVGSTSAIITHTPSSSTDTAASTITALSHLHKKLRSRPHPSVSDELDVMREEDTASGSRILQAEIPRVSVADEADANSPIVLENACLRVELDSTTGLISAIATKYPEQLDMEVEDIDALEAHIEPLRVPVHQSFGYYATSESGAYLFRPVAAPVDVTSSAWNRDGGTSVTFTTTSKRTQHSAEAAERRANGQKTQFRASGLLVQEVQAITSTYTQTVRLTDTLGWAAGELRTHSAAAIATLCRDPLLSDTSIELRPSIIAEGGQEVVMILDTNIDVLPKEPSANAERRTKNGETTSSSPELSESILDRCFWSSNLRDNLAGMLVRAPSWPSDTTGNSTSFCSTQGIVLPTGWWTSDSLGLLRRPPAPPSVTHRNINRHYYPMAALTRVAGAVDQSGATAAHAWLTVYSEQPFGTTTRAYKRSGNVGGSQLEVMMHRHLLNDDGRGLGTGVIDTTRLATRLSLTLGATVRKQRNTQQPLNEHANTLCKSSCADNTLTAFEEIHDDWLWAWSTRSTVHHSALTVLHADLADLPASVRSKSVPSDASKEDAVASRITTLHTRPLFIAPPRDAFANRGNLDFVAAERAVPIATWRSRYSTRFSPATAPLWTPILTDNVATADKCHSGAVWRETPQKAARCRAFSGGDTNVRLSASTSSAPAELPPWVNILSLHARDAVSDDVVLRLQNSGGPSIRVATRGLLAGNAAAEATEAMAAAAKENTASSSTGVSSAARAVAVALPRFLHALRPRTVSLAHHEDYALSPARHRGGVPHVDDVTHRHRLQFISADASGSGSRSDEAKLYSTALYDLTALMRTPRDDVIRDAVKLATARGATAAADSDGTDRHAYNNGNAARQNTDEDGVFLSDAALQKIKLDKERAAAAAAEAHGPMNAPRMLLQLQLQNPFANRLSMLRRGANMVKPEADTSRHRHILLPPATIRSFFASLVADDAEIAAVSKSLIRTLQVKEEAEETNGKDIETGNEPISKPNPSSTRAIAPSSAVVARNGQANNAPGVRSSAAVVIPKNPWGMDRISDSPIPTRLDSIKNIRDSYASPVPPQRTGGAVTDGKGLRFPMRGSTGALEVVELPDSLRWIISMAFLLSICCCCCWVCCWCCAPSAGPQGRACRDTNAESNTGGWLTNLWPLGAEAASNPRLAYKKAVHSSKLV